MSVLLSQYDAVSDSTPQPKKMAISEGDWSAYLREITNCRGDILSRQALDDVISYKRACALAYLGRRAQKNGGVCSRSQPRIFTTQAISDLGKANADVRYARYPWLEKLLKLMADIESIQDEISVQGNIISLPAHHSFPGSANRNTVKSFSTKTPSFSFDSPARA